MVVVVVDRIGRAGLRDTAEPDRRGGVHVVGVDVLAADQRPRDRPPTTTRAAVTPRTTVRSAIGHK